MKRQRGIDFGECVGVFFSRKLKKGKRVAVGYYTREESVYEFCLIYYDLSGKKVIISEVEYIKEIYNYADLSIMLGLFIETFLRRRIAVYLPIMYSPPVDITPNIRINHVSRIRDGYMFYCILSTTELDEIY